MFKVNSNTGSVCPDAFAVPSRVTVTDSILSVVKGPAFGGGGGAWDEDGGGELAVEAGDDEEGDAPEDGGDDEGGEDVAGDGVEGGVL